MCTGLWNAAVHCDRRLDLIAEHGKGSKIPVGEILAPGGNVHEIIETEGRGQHYRSDKGKDPGSWRFYPACRFGSTGAWFLGRDARIRIIRHDSRPGESAWNLWVRLGCKVYTYSSRVNHHIQICSRFRTRLPPLAAVTLISMGTGLWLDGKKAKFIVKLSFRRSCLRSCFAPPFVSGPRCQCFRTDCGAGPDAHRQPSAGKSGCEPRKAEMMQSESRTTRMPEPSDQVIYRF